MLQFDGSEKEQSIKYPSLVHDIEGVVHVSTSILQTMWRQAGGSV